MFEGTEAALAFHSQRIILQGQWGGDQLSHYAPQGIPSIHSSHCAQEVDLRKKNQLVCNNTKALNAITIIFYMQVEIVRQIPGN